jgi:hypothetical protein
MIDWVSVRFFEAVAHPGRAAQDQSLALPHRIAQLEDLIGAQLYEKLASEYCITSTGEVAPDAAERMKASTHKLDALLRVPRQ